MPVLQEQKPVIADRRSAGDGHCSSPAVFRRRRLGEVFVSGSFINDSGAANGCLSGVGLEEVMTYQMG